MNPENSHSNTLFIGSLPATVTNEELESLFGEIGPLKRCFVVSGKGVGYVTYAFREDAETAMKDIKTLKNGKKLNVRIANKKINKKGFNAKSGESIDPANVSPESEEKKSKFLGKRINTVNKQEGRLILRNLSFKTEVGDIRKAFSKYGKVKEVSIPTKSDGKKQGFGFVQFEVYEDAVNAIKNLNAKPFMGRPIAVDHAIPQTEYLRIKTENNNDFTEIKVENTEENQKPYNKQKNIGIKVEKTSTSNHRDEGSNSDSSEIGESEINDDDDETIKWIKSKRDDDGSSDEKNTESEDDESSDENGEDDSEEDDDNGEDKLSESGSEDDDSESAKKKTEKKKPKHKNCDVNEGKTLFIRNLNFTTTSEKLKEVFSQFGALEYATVCVDRFTEHSKGSGFVKFREKSDAERCLRLILESPKDGGIVIDDFKIEVNSAISKTDLNKSEKMKKLDKKKCNRNLFLTREGMVRPGTQAAEGVSQPDLTKRTEVELWKRQMLKNLHVFVSKTRLCVRNLPPNVDDFKLRKIFEKAAGTKAEVTECKVMRFLDQPGPDGYGLSKGYGFINFTEHESALKALRQVNNNPNIFTAQKRPIVEFSLENKSALRAKQKRLEKSTVNRKEKLSSINHQSSKVNKETKKHDYDDGDEKPSFIGTKSEELRFKKGLPSHVGPKIRHNRKISRNLLKKQKKSNQRGRNFNIKEKQENKRMHKMMARKPNDSDKYDLIRSQKLNLGKKLPVTKKSKWYSQ